MRGRYWLLTYPKNSTTVEEYSNRLLEKWGDKVQDYIVGREKHSDGTPHLHVCIIFKKAMTVRSSAFESLGAKHGNWKKVTPGWRSISDTVLYCAKHGEYHATPKLVEWAEQCKKDGQDPNAPSERSKLVEVQRRLEKGATTATIVKEFPQHALAHLRKIQDMEIFLRNERQKLVPSQQFMGLEWKGPYFPPEWAEQIIHWFNTQIKLRDANGERPGRPIRSTQLHIVGPPGCGKTSFMQELAKYLRIYFIPSDENWYDLFENDTYDLAVLDEYTGGKTIAWLNRWLDGSTQMVPIKGKTAVFKIQNIPTLIMGNKTMEVIYKEHAERRDPSLEALCGGNGRLRTVILPDNVGYIPGSIVPRTTPVVIETEEQII